eukprot:4756490-Prymnesium_polylepis.2
MPTADEKSRRTRSPLGCAHCRPSTGTLQRNSNIPIETKAALPQRWKEHGRTVPRTANCAPLRAELLDARIMSGRRGRKCNFRCTRQAWRREV